MRKRSAVERELEAINAKLQRLEKMVSERATEGPRRRAQPRERPEWMRPFLEALERLGAVLPALREVGRPGSNKTLYNHRADDGWFRTEWDNALARYEAREGAPA